MNYSEPLYQQIFVFFKAVSSGLIIGLFYDALETVQKIISDKRSVVITKDLIFCFFASVFSFFFMVLYNNGRARLILFIAQLLGAVVFHFCLGKCLSGILTKIGLRVKNVIFILFSPFIKIYEKAVGWGGKLVLKTKTILLEKKQKRITEKKLKKEKSKKIRRKHRKRTKNEKNSDIQ